MGLAIFSLLGICVLGISARERNRALPALMIVALMVSLPSCGGGGGGGTTPNPVPTISSLSPASQVVGSQSQMVTINGSGFIVGSTVTYNNEPEYGTTLMSGSQISLTLGSSEMAKQGSFPVVVTNPSPGGGASSPANFNVVAKGTPTGTFNITVTASSGTLTHSTTVALVVQSQ